MDIAGCMRSRADGCADYSTQQHTDEPAHQHTDKSTNQHFNTHPNTATYADAHTTTAHTDAHTDTDTCPVAQTLDERRVLRATILVARLEASVVH
jgi:hypothetical protein